MVMPCSSELCLLLFDPAVQFLRSSKPRSSGTKN